MLKRGQSGELEELKNKSKIYRINTKKCKLKQTELKLTESQTQ